MGNLQQNKFHSVSVTIIFAMKKIHLLLWMIRIVILFWHAPLGEGISFKKIKFCGAMPVVAKISINE
jgi:hypothetical protein